MIGLKKLAPGPGHVALAEHAQPTPGPGQALLEVRGTGICGTDLHIEAGEYRCDPPLVLGHEISSVVTAVGEGVPEEWIGARVVNETTFWTCGACAWCRDGRTNLCPRRRSIGTHVDGGFASHAVAPAHALHRIPEWLDEHLAALSEPLACVCHCLLDPPVVAPGDRVLVTGPGPIGLLAAQVARALGGSVLVTGLPTDARRLEVAESLGLEVTDAGAGVGEFDVAIEASGAAGGIRTCLAAVRRGGGYVQIGIFGRDVEVPLDDVLFKELAVATGFASTPRSWRRALALVEQRDVALEPLVSEIAPLSDWQRVFADLRAGAGMKVVLDPRLG